MFYVYILRCRDGTLYTGYTNDIAKRLAAHSTGNGSKYTRSRLPATLEAQFECKSKSEALRLEASIKKMPRAAKIGMISHALK